jgi:hypothetical protein
MSIPILEKCSPPYFSGLLLWVATENVKREVAISARRFELSAFDKILRASYDNFLAAFRRLFRFSQSLLQIINEVMRALR